MTWRIGSPMVRVGSIVLVVALSCGAPVAWESDDAGGDGASGDVPEPTTPAPTDPPVTTAPPATTSPPESTLPVVADA